MMLKKIFFLFVIGASFHSRALWSTENVFHIQYTKEYDTLDEIAIRYFPIVKSKYNNQLIFYKKDLIRWNPHITNWKSLTNRRAIYIDSPSESERKYDAINRRWSFFLFYSAHYGTFTEHVNEQSINSSQTSPATLGLTSYYNLSNRKHALVSNISYSYLRGSTITGTVANTDQDIKIPAELGVSLYYQYNFNYILPTLYTGFDRETFSSFNTSELLQGDSLEIRKNVLYFYTFGFIKSFELKKNALTIRASYAKTFKSTTTSANINDKFVGTRLNFYLSIKGTNNFSYNFLFKRFDLSGTTKLVVNRFGVGIGYQFY